MMVYIATKHLNYNSKNEYTIKEQHQILNAARRLVCYSKGYHEPEGKPRQLEHYFDTLDKYSSFHGYMPLPIGTSPELQSKKETKIEMMERRYPKLLLTAYRKTVKSIGDKVSYERITEGMNKIIPTLITTQQQQTELPPPTLYRWDFAQFF